MEIEWNKNKIKFNKILNSLDKFTIDFCNKLNKLKINYVIISGYVAILFGRSRSSEDIDLFIERLDKDRFYKFWDKITEDYECLNTSKKEEAYNEYLIDGYALRFSLKGRFIPNMEIKFPKQKNEEFVLKNRIKIIINNKTIYTSPIEEQIAIKLKLGSEKDIEDAVHLFNIFKEYLDKKKLSLLLKSYNIKDNIKRFLK